MTYGIDECGIDEWTVWHRRLDSWLLWMCRNSSCWRENVSWVLPSQLVMREWWLAWSLCLGSLLWEMPNFCLFWEDSDAASLVWTLSETFVSFLQEALGGSSWQCTQRMSLEHAAPGQGHGQEHGLFSVLQITDFKYSLPLHFLLFCRLAAELCLLQAVTQGLDLPWPSTCMPKASLFMLVACKR